MATNNEQKETLGSLGKLTKAKLIEIILRKDDVEKKLNKEIEQLKEEVNNYCSRGNKAYSELATVKLELAKANNVNEELKAGFDDNASELQEVKDCLAFWKTLTIMLGLVVLLYLAFKIILSLS